MSTPHEIEIRSQVLVPVEELGDRLARKEEIVLLDVRLPEEGEDQDRTAPYRAGHLPGAIHVDLPTELAGKPGGFRGRQPLPEIEDLQTNARRWGIKKSSAVVVYGNRRGTQAARGWWVLRWAGFSNVRLLDGGLPAWVDSGRPLSIETPRPEPGNIVLSAGHLPVLDADGAAALARTGILLDARGIAQYQGSPAHAGKPLSGHIPGALSAPTSENLTKNGRFADPKALSERFAALGIETEPKIPKAIGVYCGGGVAAAHEIAALASIGIEAALFPGSWSAWSSDPQRPAATGPERG